jgi:hypothetical protein
MNIRDRANNQKCDEVRIHRSSRRNFLTAFLTIQIHKSQRRNEGPENKALANVRPTSNLPAPTDDSDINPVAFLC